MEQERRTYYALGKCFEKKIKTIEDQREKKINSKSRKN